DFCASKLSWFSIAEPTAHALPFDHVCGIRVGGGRILARRQSGKTAEVFLSDLAGNKRTLASGPADTLDVVGLAGGKAAWSDQRCDGLHVVSADVSSSEPGTTSPSDVTCPAKIGNGKTVKVSKSGKLFVDVLCPRGCLDVTISILADPFDAKRDA